MNDLISRQDAIKAVCGDCTIANRESCKRDGYCYEVRKLMALPSAEPKTGKWMPIIEGNELGEAYQSGAYCSECGEQIGYESNFCPSCGADMRGE